MTRTHWFLYLTITFKYALVAAGDFCPTNHPFAYNGGQHCCTYNEEKDCGNLGPGCDGGIIGNSSRCCKNDEFIQCVNKPCRNLDCGLGSILATRIIRGDEAIEHSFPWMTSIRLDSTHFCGGSLINEEYVLTAGHCFWSLTDIATWVGLKNLTDEEILPRMKLVLGDHVVNTSEPEEQIFAIADYTFLTPNKNRSGATLANDVAVIRLDKKAKFNEYVSPVCLATPSMGVSPGEKLTVAGWGLSKRPIYDDKLVVRFPEKYSNVLKVAVMKVIKNEDCANLFDPVDKNGDLVYYGHPAAEDMICTREENDQGDTSNGDSGSPLMKRDPKSGRWIQFGILSYGWGRGGENGYTKVGYFYESILEMMEKLEKRKGKN